MSKWVTGMKTLSLDLTIEDIKSYTKLDKITKIEFKYLDSGVVSMVIHGEKDKVVKLSEVLSQKDTELFDKFDPVTASAIRDLGLSAEQAIELGAREKEDNAS